MTQYCNYLSTKNKFKKKTGEELEQGCGLATFPAKGKKKKKRPRIQINSPKGQKRIFFLLQQVSCHSWAANIGLQGALLSAVLNAGLRSLLGNSPEQATGDLWLCPVTITAVTLLTNT